MGCGCWPKRSGRKRSRLRKFFRRKKKDVNVSEAAAIPDQGTLPVPAQEPLAPEPLAQEPLAQEPLVQEPPVQEAVLSQTQAVIPEVKPRMDVAVYKPKELGIVLKKTKKPTVTMKLDERSLLEIHLQMEAQIQDLRMMIWKYETSCLYNMVEAFQGLLDAMRPPLALEAPPQLLALPAPPVVEAVSQPGCTITVKAFAELNALQVHLHMEEEVQELRKMLVTYETACIFKMARAFQALLDGIRPPLALEAPPQLLALPAPPVVEAVSQPGCIITVKAFAELNALQVHLHMEEEVQELRKMLVTYETACIFKMARAFQALLDGIRPPLALEAPPQLLALPAPPVVEAVSQPGCIITVKAFAELNALQVHLHMEEEVQELRKMLVTYETACIFNMARAFQGLLDAMRPPLALEAPPQFLALPAPQVVEVVSQPKCIINQGALPKLSTLQVHLQMEGKVEELRQMIVKFETKCLIDMAEEYQALMDLLRTPLALEAPSKLLALPAPPMVAALSEVPTFHPGQVVSILHDDLLPPTLALETPSEDLTLPAPIKVATLPKQVVPIPPNAPREVLPEEKTLPPPIEELGVCANLVDVSTDENVNFYAHEMAWMNTAFDTLDDLVKFVCDISPDDTASMDVFLTEYKRLLIEREDEAAAGHEGIDKFLFHYPPDAPWMDIPLNAYCHVVTDIENGIAGSRDLNDIMNDCSLDETLKPLFKDLISGHVEFSHVSENIKPQDPQPEKSYAKVQKKVKKNASSRKKKRK